MAIGKNHQLKIARQTMNLSCAGSRILGGMNHIQAAAILNKKVDEDCNCFETHKFTNLVEIIASDFHDILRV